MQFRELRLAGFKSFVEPTRLSVETGLTGIVGPNGCGKSNLLEAMRWVMGAASAKALRGEEMDDVIFAGSGNRPAREYAEVTLVLSNEDGRAPAPFNEADSLEIIRRIKRQAGSTYRINGKEARARDVQLLFADASTGANSPSLVRQGQVSELINAKPENRRRILEEAAGIAGLQTRRHDAELKLVAAETNLKRVEEIAQEIESQLGQLRKQARQAQTYRNLQQQIRALELLIASRKWHDCVRLADQALALAQGAEAHWQSTQSTLQNGQAAEAEGLARLKPMEEESLLANVIVTRYASERDDITRALAEAEGRVAQIHDELSRLDADAERENLLEADAIAALARLEDEARSLATLELPDAQIESELAGQLASIEARRSQAEGELETALRAMAAAQARQEAAQREAIATQKKLENAQSMLAQAQESEHQARSALAPLEVDWQQIQAQMQDLEQRAVQAASALQTAESAHQLADQADKQARTNRNQIENQLRASEAERDGLKKAFVTPQTQSFPAILREIRVEPGYERALAAALGDDLDASRGAGGLVIWSGNSRDNLDGPAILPVGQVLTLFVQAPAEMQNRLRTCFLVDRLKGEALQKQLAPGQRLVSREGDLWRWDGFTRRAEAPSPQVARLAQQNRLDALEAEISSLRAQYEVAKSQAAQTRAALQNAEQQLGQARKLVPAAQASLQTRRQDENRILRQRDGAQLRLESAQAELSRAKDALHALQPSADRVFGSAKSDELVGPANEYGGAGAVSIDGLRAQVAALRQEAAQVSAELAGLALTRKQARQRLDTHRDEVAAWQKRKALAAGRLNLMAKSRIEAENNLEKWREAPVQLAQKRDQLLDAMTLAERRKIVAADQLREAQAQNKTLEKQRRDAEKAHGEAGEARAAALARLEAAQARRGEVEAEIRLTFSDHPENLAAKAVAGIEPRDSELLKPELPIAELSVRLEKKLRDREAMGAVNLMAEAAASEQETRLATLLSERSDILGAIVKLRQSGAALDAEGRARLLAAFEIVNGHFQSLFQTLFEGGQAELKLTQSADALSAGLEILACPPGKRLATLSLMSGGEQALTATALIFAVFLSNPAPICVLDEVDAPLDDANVERFCHLLDEMRKRTQTRFLVITHNPVTMARMDRLFGVTMSEPGVSNLVSVDLKRAEALIAQSAV